MEILRIPSLAEKELRWRAPSPCSPASGPTCRSPSSRRSAAALGFDGLELACWGDHFEVDKALADDGYVRSLRELLERHELGVWAIGAHLVGQAVCDRIDGRHRAILPPEVYGDGDPYGLERPGLPLA